MADRAAILKRHRYCLRNRQDWQVYRNFAKGHWDVRKATAEMVLSAANLTWGGRNG